MTFAGYMDIWRCWMMQADGPEEYRRVAVGFDQAMSNYAVAEDDSDAASDLRELGYGPIIDACIDSLEPHERWSVHYCYRITGALSFPRVNPYATFLGCKPRLIRIIACRLPVEADREDCGRNLQLAGSAC